MAERFALLILIVLGEGFFKLVATLSEKGSYKVAPDILVSFSFGGTAIFILCWIYFDVVGNGKPKNNSLRVLVIWWIAHLLLMLCGAMIGVALTGEVEVGFWEPLPTRYAAAGCFDVAGYIAMLWVLGKVIEHRAATDFGRWDVCVFDTFSQIALPLTRAWLKFRHE